MHACAGVDGNGVCGRTWSAGRWASEDAMRRNSRGREAAPAVGEEEWARHEQGEEGLAHRGCERLCGDESHVAYSGR